MAHILLIEDDEALRGIIGEGLKHAGHTVDEAGNGKVGLALYRPDKTDLVITDIIMPEKEGLETIAQMKAKFPEVEIIAISGGGRPGGLDPLYVAAKMGAGSTLQKPFTFEQLMAVVNERLGVAD
jgi:DNA-binding NtrC family response regulator